MIDVRLHAHAINFYPRSDAREKERLRKININKSKKDRNSINVPTYMMELGTLGQDREA